MDEHQLENMFNELMVHRYDDPIIIEHAHFHFFAGAAAILMCIGNLDVSTPEKFAYGMTSLMAQVNNTVDDILAADREAE